MPPDFPNVVVSLRDFPDFPGRVTFGDFPISLSISLISLVSFVNIERDFPDFPQISCLFPDFPRVILLISRFPFRFP